MKKRLIVIAGFFDSIMSNKILLHIGFFLMSITPLALAIMVTIDYCHGIKYESIPLGFAWSLGGISSFGLFALWSQTWNLK